MTVWRVVGVAALVGAATFFYSRVTAPPTVCSCQAAAASEAAR